MKSKPEDQSIDNQTDTSIDRLKQLENELLKLKIDNAYLRLRLEENAHLKKQRESSKASDENSN